jgi:sporulation protein YlmC with PRC-barrel domain
MLNVVRRSQIVGLTLIDSASTSRLGEVEDVWLDEQGRIAYLSGAVGYIPLEQIAGIGTQAISTYGTLVIESPLNLQQLHQLTVQSPLGESLGWVEDFLFDWQTGEVVAYILAGDITEPLGERAVLFPTDVQEITTERVVIQEQAQGQLKRESEGLKGFLSEKSQQVQHLVKVISDRLHSVIAPHDKPEVVRVKVKEVSDELAATGHHDHNALQEATAYLQEQWHSLQQSLERAGSRAKIAIGQAWKQLTGRP